MARKFGFSVWCSLWLIVLVLPGCRRSQEGAESTRPSPSSQESTESKSPSANIIVTLKGSNILKRINIAYCNYCTAYGKAPANVEKLRPYLVCTDFPASERKWEEEILQLLKQGEIVVIWNQKAVSDKMKKGTGVVTAYEKRTPIQGGFVGYSDGRVEWSTPAELEQILKKVEMASPEAKSKLDLPVTPKQSLEKSDKVK